MGTPRPLTAAPEPTPAPTGTAVAEPDETAVAITESPAEEPTLADIQGYWCPSSLAPDDGPCIEIRLPEVMRDGNSDPEYVYPPSLASGDDPRDPTQLTDTDYRTPPDYGGCFRAAVDGYPSDSGAALIYCPAHAMTGESWLDDPDYWDQVEWAADLDISDYRDQDRVYITQEEDPFPYLRASS